ncbi:FAD-dependent oxidoreductase [Asticcacaulis sp. AC402]|uniref:FAD-dependent oxidoreductase n=1 Tax=Asticcacaulis sp. AC402 TaxID=1282361 RepID=UPI0003C3FC02|nr:FAD-dependent oxidoreductase [Asticcacaulis sp. AC402]ESQ74348.1 D-amino acid oxidase [Asticcacaulis sp. AC402]
MDRRHLFRTGLAAAGLSALPTLVRADAPIIPIRVNAPDVFRTTVCLRPFRAAGPRIETEVVGRKIVVHNYGHGGSGWSLSWGSAEAAVKLAMQSSPEKIAVIGAGALGLTAAITAQRAGADVTIYARERFPFVRSARATGSWTPDSRIAKTAAVDAGFADRWERMARTSLVLHRGFVGLGGNPVEWMDQYVLRKPPAPELAPSSLPPAVEPEDPGFVYLEDRLRDVVPRFHAYTGVHPFNAGEIRRGTIMTFNVASYCHQLESDFLAAGGRFEAMEFHTPSDLSRLKEKVVVNCTGYGARALFRDESITPVRGQIVWLVPQADVHYGLYISGLLVLARRDGIVVQATGGEMSGWNDDNETPDSIAAQAALDRLKSIYA